MYIPKIVVQPLQARFNVRLICNYLSPAKASNKTRPFAEKTYAMYPELRGVLGEKNDEERNHIIKLAVEKRLSDSAAEINARVMYFQKKFDSFLGGSSPKKRKCWTYGNLDYHFLFKGPNGV